MKEGILPVVDPKACIIDERAMPARMQKFTNAGCKNEECHRG